jgi:hypothetical protein
MAQVLYIVTYPAGTGTPDGPQIVAGHDATDSAASWAGNATWTGSGQYLEATGLSASTEYDSAAVIYDGTTYSNVVQVVDTWTTLSGTAYTLTANNGTLTLTGQSAGITRSKVLTAQAGTLSITGQSATITRSKRIVASNGTLTLTGQSAIIKRGKVLTANNGTLTLTGQSATITRTTVGAYDLIAQHGTLSLTGQNATITRSRSIVAQNGTFTLTGQSAGITWAAASSLTPEDIAAIADAVWAHPDAIAAHEQLDQILACCNG